jgi:hypothetical protein
LIIQNSNESLPLRLFPDQPNDDHHHADTDGGSRNLTRKPHQLLRVRGHRNVRGHNEKEYKRKHDKEHAPTDHPPIDPSHIILLQLPIGIKIRSDFIALMTDSSRAFLIEFLAKDRCVEITSSGMHLDAGWVGQFF